LRWSTNFKRGMARPLAQWLIYAVSPREPGSTFLLTPFFVGRQTRKDPNMALCTYVQQAN
jgi:hypothetical protein